MADTLPFKLVTPTGTLFDGPVREVTAVNPIGEFGVLPEHINYITALVPGVITVKLPSGESQFFVVTGGLAEVKDGQMMVLASHAEPAQDIAAGEGPNELLAAEEKLHHMSFYAPGYEQALHAVQLAQARQRAIQLRSQLR